MAKNDYTQPVVQLPRAVAPDWWGQSWEDVVAAVNGGRIEDAAVKPEKEYHTGQAPDGYAWLRECNGRAFLLSQGW